MNDKEVYSYLCSYDKRSPDYLDLIDEDDPEPVPRVDCFCDNCFNGRDMLALEIIKLKKGRDNI